MTRLSNILPNKHVRFSDSILALAGFLRQFLDRPRSVDELWAIITDNKDRWPAQPTFTSLVLAIDTLFALGLVVPTGDDGRISLRQP